MRNNKDFYNFNETELFSI